MTAWRAPLAAAVLLFLPPQPGPAISFITPSPDDYIVGDTRFALTVDPAGQRIALVTLAIDGIEACRFTAPPFDCRFNVGREVRGHAVRAVVTFASGVRSVRTLSTAELTVTETSEVESVLVGVTVTDSHGRFVRGLGLDDFRLFRNDVRQPVTFFAPEGWRCDVVLAVDVSGSMKTNAGAVRQAVRAFLSLLRPDDDVTVAAFNTAMFVVAPWGAKLEVRTRAVDRLSSWGGTAMFDAILSGLDLLEGRSGRRALVLFTDGEDQSSQASARSVEQRLLADDVLLYVVGHGSAAKLPALRGDMERVAAGTGGRALFIEDVGDAQKVFREVVDDLTQQYTLGFTPLFSPPGEWQKLRVELDNRKYHVRARQGYASKPKTGR